MKPEIVDPVRDAEQLDVVLLSPPYDFPPRPSIALSLFRQCLNEAGMRAQVLYPMFRLSHMLGWMPAAGSMLFRTVRVWKSISLRI